MLKHLPIVNNTISLSKQILIEAGIGNDRQVYFQDNGNSIKIQTLPITNKYGYSLLTTNGELRIPREILARLDDDNLILEVVEGVGMFILLPTMEDDLDKFIYEQKKSDNHFPVVLLDPNNEFEELEIELRRRTKLLDHVVRDASTDSFYSREFYSIINPEALAKIKFSKKDLGLSLIQKDPLDLILEDLKKDIDSDVIKYVEIRNGSSLKNSFNTISKVTKIGNI